MKGYDFWKTTPDEQHWGAVHLREAEVEKELALIHKAPIGEIIGEFETEHTEAVLTAVERLFRLGEPSNWYGHESAKKAISELMEAWHKAEYAAAEYRVDRLREYAAEAAAEALYPD